MRYFDLHCDTLYRVVTEKLDFTSEKLSVNLHKADCLSDYHQLMAIWIPDRIRGEEAFAFFKECAEVYLSTYIKQNNCKYNFMLSVENGSVIGGDISKIRMLSDYGVKAVTIVYNEDNELGSGGHSDSAFGLTDIGKEAVREFENNNIYVDVSHASVRTFYDVLEISQRPVIASHSNSFSLCPHKRNITDKQFLMIKNSGGLVGVNFYPPFLNCYPDKASISDVIKHIEHFLSLGGENTVCIGSDLDGCDALKELDSLNKVPFLYESLLKLNYNEQLVQKILFTNAHNFFT